MNYLQGQFNYACVIIEPLDHGSNQVTVKVREELVEHVGNSEPKIVSDQNVAVLARQLALHANVSGIFLFPINLSHFYNILPDIFLNSSLLTFLM